MDDRSQRRREDRRLGGEGGRDASIDKEPVKGLGLAAFAREDAYVGLFDDGLGEFLLRVPVIALDWDSFRQFQEHARRLIEDIFVF